MTLRPVLPALPDETLTSYMRRVAKFHGGMGVYAFLNMIELSRGAVMAPTSEDLDRISVLTGQPHEVLDRMVFVSAGPRLRRLGAQTFHADFANSNQTSFCPACLLEDGVPDGPSCGLRVGRVSWLLEPVRTCRRHGIALVRRNNTAHSEKFQHMDEVAPDDTELAGLVAAADRRAPSTLQEYVEARLDGGHGPAWLDGQPIDLGARACELLGLLLTHKATRGLPHVSTSELDAAGAVGFQYAARGREGIREALSAVHDRSRGRSHNGGPQEAFGFLYSFLQFKKNRKSPGPIRDVMREYILDNFAIDAGTVLFGEVVIEARKHNIRSLARKTGEHPKTIHHAMVRAGIVNADPDHPSRHHVFDAGPAERLIERMKTALSARDLQKQLNCNRMQAELLVRTGIIPRIVDDAERAKGAMKLVAREDAEAFLDRLLGCARRVDELSDGMADIVTAAGISRWPVVDIVNGILAARFMRVECADPSLRFKSVFVDPVEIRSVLGRQVSDDHVNAHEAARMLGMQTAGIRTLVKLRDHTGAPFLNEEAIENTKGVRTSVYLRTELRTFRDEHTPLREIASRQGMLPRWMKVRLDAAGVMPIAPYKGLGALYYRRADLGEFAPD